MSTSTRPPCTPLPSATRPLTPDSMPHSPIPKLPPAIHTCDVRPHFPHPNPPIPSHTSFLKFESPPLTQVQRRHHHVRDDAAGGARHRRRPLATPGRGRGAPAQEPEVEARLSHLIHTSFTPHSIHTLPTPHSHRMLTFFTHNTIFQSRGAHPTHSAHAFSRTLTSSPTPIHVRVHMNRPSSHRHSHLRGYSLFSHPINTLYARTLATHTPHPHPAFLSPFTGCAGQSKPSRTPSSHRHSHPRTPFRFSLPIHTTS